MTRVNFVKKARKDNPVVKKGESYYWWKFPFGGKHYSATHPKRSQLTQSDFLAQVYDIEDEMNGNSNIEQFMIDEWISELESLRDECQDKLDNMPEQLQEGSSSGQLLQERIDALDDWISSLENIDCEIDDDENEEDRMEEIKGEVSDANPGVV